MINFITATDWTIRILELVTVLFLVVTFSKHRFALFFGGKVNLKSQNDHTLHSCFIAALTVMVFHFVSSALAQNIIALEMEKMQLRQFFYFTMFSCSLAFAVILFLLHVLRGCTFSLTARLCIYLSILQAILQMLQFVMRGMLDNSILSPFYSTTVLVLNVLSLAVVASFPIKQFFQRRKEVA